MGNDMEPEQTQSTESMSEGLVSGSSVPEMPVPKTPVSREPVAREPAAKDPVSKGRVTIREVAERAGVSTATTSRALSGNHPVPAATRARVLRAARELDYVANAHARALVGGGRKMAAVVVRQVTSPFYAQVAEGVEAEAADRGWLCVVGATGETRSARWSSCGSCGRRGHGW